MKTFVDISGEDFTFSNCEACPAKCCDGREGSIFSELLLEEFEKVSKNFPILFTFGDLGYLKANVLLSNGKDFCPYIKEHRCIIYEHRPNVCKHYPLSPTIEDKIYLDDSCLAINQEEGIPIVQKGKVQKEFDKDTLHRYQERFIKSFEYLSRFNNKEFFQLVIEINGIEFYKINKEFDDPYIKLHRKSLKNLNKIINENKKGNDGAKYTSKIKQRIKW